MSVKKPLLFIMIFTCFLCFGVSIKLAYAGDLGIGPGSPFQIIRKQQDKMELDEAKKKLNVPEGCIKSFDQFDKCPTSYYTLDYVPMETYGAATPGDTTESAFLTSVASVLSFMWSLFIEVVYLAIKFFLWAYNLPILQIMSDSLQNAIKVFNKWVWAPFWALMFALSMANTIYYYAKRRMNRVVTNLISVLFIGTFSMALYHDMPHLAQNASQKFDALGKYTLTGMLAFIPDDQHTQQNGTYDQNQTEASEKEATQKMADAIWRTLAYKPTLLLNFPTVQVGEKYIKDINEYGGDSKIARRDYLTKSGYIDQSTGEAKNADFKMMTADGLETRGVRLFFLGLSGSALALIILGLAIWIIWIGVRLIAKLAWGCIKLVLSIWPEYGWRKAVDWVWSVFVLTMMKFFVSVLLGMILVLWVGMNSIDFKLLSSNPVISFVGMIVLQVGISLACYFEFKNLLSEFNLPMPWGSSLNMADTTGQAVIGGLFRKGTKLLTGGLDLTGDAAKGMVKGSAKGALAYLGRPEMFKHGLMRSFAQSQRAKINQKKAKQAVLDAGFDPNSARSREAFLHEMKKQGLRSQAAQILGRLGPIDKSAQKQPARIQSFLSSDAKDLYQKMKMAGYDPMKKIDQTKWVEERPNDAFVMEELRSYSKLQPYQRIVDPPPKDWSVAPPPPPEENTPEYDLWKNQGYMFQYRQYEKMLKKMEQERNEAYIKQQQEYQALPKLKRLIQKPPVLPGPPKADEVLQRLREQQSPQTSEFKHKQVREVD